MKNNETLLICNMNSWIKLRLNWYSILNNFDTFDTLAAYDFFLNFWLFLEMDFFSAIKF